MNAPSRILLMEDDPKLARFLQLELSSEVYQILLACDGPTGLTIAREETPDLTLMDWMMPEMTGVEVCRRLRATSCKTPIVLLKAKDDMTDRVAGLDAGSDDYVVNPFSIEELLARVRAHLRRNSEEEGDRLIFTDLSLDKRTREVTRAAIDRVDGQGV